MNAVELSFRVRIVFSIGVSRVVGECSVAWPGSFAVADSSFRGSGNTAMPVCE